MTDLYSSEYVQQLNQLHQKKRTFGDRTGLGDIEQWINKYQPATFIDYGCGKGGLVNTINDLYPDSCVGYDPGYPEYNVQPEQPVEMLISTDVLEHIEPQYVDNVLQHIDSLFTRVAYLLIATSPAKKSLPDGRNAHLIQEEPDWWRPRLLENINGKIVDEKYKLGSWTNKRTGQEHPNNKFIVVMEK
jgi:hypothetical protein